MTLVAALPIVVALVLLVGLRWPAVRAMPLCAAVTALSAALFWRVPAVRLAAATVEAAWVTVSILWIVFGALFFLALLRRTGAIGVLQRSFASLSPDGRLQAVLVGWVLGSFLEGAAGFGTPAAITAPLLIGLGFPPLQAVVVALVGDSTAVSFGAVGTPMLIGMGQGLGSPGVGSIPSVEAIAQRIATYDLVLGTLMPALVVLALVLTVEGRRGWRSALPAVPFALGVGLAQAAVAWVVVFTLGPEFPSLLGPLAGLLTALVLLRRGWWVPSQMWRLAGAVGSEREPKREPEREPEPTVAAGAAVRASGDGGSPSAARAFAPYLLLLVLLVLTRARALPFGAWLSGLSVESGPLLGTDISAQLQLLYSPGAVFVVCALLSALWLRAGGRGLAAAARSGGAVTLKTAVALFAALTTVRIFLHSGGNEAGLEAMPLVLAQTLAAGLGEGWPVAAPWVGALGAFIAGSATFSNMLFALLQLEVALDLGHAPVSILALQGVGAAAGNMVCIHNVLAACAVAGILGREGGVIRRTALPMVAYLLVAGLLGLVLF
jgi:lactate permease